MKTIVSILAVITLVGCTRDAPHVGPSQEQVLPPMEEQAQTQNQNAAPEEQRAQTQEQKAIPEESSEQTKSRTKRASPGAVSDAAENAARRAKTRTTGTTSGAASTSNSLPGVTPEVKEDQGDSAVLPNKGNVNPPTTTTDQMQAAPGATGESNKAGLGTRKDERPITMAYRVADMDCDGCERRVRDAVRKVPGVKNVRASARTGQVIFEIESRDKVDETAVIRSIEREGFRVIR